MLSDEELTPESVVWPAVILRGNGDVCLLNTSLASNEKPKFEGPLTIYPPADDNYGVDACSILVLPTVPNTIVLATSSGTLYHCVLLKLNGDEVRNSLTSFYINFLVVISLKNFNFLLEINNHKYYSRALRTRIRRIGIRHPIKRWRSFLHLPSASP